jgi:hypothetical protein
MHRSAHDHRLAMDQHPRRRAMILGPMPERIRTPTRSGNRFCSKIRSDPGGTRRLGRFWANEGESDDEENEISTPTRLKSS